jgi:hypothetical protein
MNTNICKKSRFLVRFVGCALVALVFTVFAGTATVWADIGPKPSIDIRMTSVPDQPYYMDLLAPPDEQGDWKWLEENAKEEELFQHYDAKMLEVLREYELDGWKPLMTTGASGRLTGDVESWMVSEEGTARHSFGYFGTPSVFRIIVVTEDLQVTVSDVIERKGMQVQVDFDYVTAQHQSTVTMTYEQAEEIMEKENSLITPQPSWKTAALVFLKTFLPTLLIEGIILLLFRFPLRRNWKWLLLVNFVTQLGLHLFLHATGSTPGVLGFVWMTLAAEGVIVVVEAVAYRFLLRPHSPKRRVLYAVAANVASFAIGELVYYLLLR